MKKRFSQIQIIALGFFVMIAVGTALLMLPFATASGESASFADAVFTATSASCVTGLVVQDTGTYWSLFGQIVILCLIQIGGLGFMTVATMFSLLMRRRIGLREREMMVTSTSAAHIAGILGLTKEIIIGTMIFEGVGALLLAIRFVPMLGVGTGLYYSVFHAVSGFCNAGFDLLGGISGKYASFVDFSDDTLVNLTLMALIVTGGLGFLVWDDLRKKRFKFRRLCLHSKIVLVVSAVLVFGGAALFMIFERNNLNAGVGVKESILTSLFASVTARTAGFNTVDIASMSAGSKLLTIVLMFIGGSSGSTAGGIKTTTIAAIAIFSYAGIRRKTEAGIFGRRLSDDTLKKANGVLFTNLFLALAATLIICAVQDFDIGGILFETFSAIGTVGMSAGLTRDLGGLPRLIIVFLMFCGRVGSVSFALALLEKRARPLVLDPVENISIG